MATDLLHERGRGPELIGTRITVYNLLPHFLDPTATESYICQLYGLTPEQVAAARAFVLHHADTVLVEHLKIEASMEAGNPPEVIAKARQTHAAFEKLKRRLAEQASPGKDSSLAAAQPILPTFREWFVEQESRTFDGT